MLDGRLLVFACRRLVEGFLTRLGREELARGGEVGLDQFRDRILLFLADEALEDGVIEDCVRIRQSKCEA